MGVAVSLEKNDTQIKIVYVAHRRQVKSVEFVQVVCNSIKKGEGSGFISSLPSQTVVPPERDSWLDRYTYNFANQYYHVDTSINNVNVFYLNGGNGQRATLMEDAYMIDSPFVGAIRYPPEVTEIKMDFVTLVLCSDGIETHKGQYLAMVRWSYLERKTGDTTQQGQIQIIATADAPDASGINVPAGALHAIIKFCEMT